MATTARARQLKAMTERAGSRCIWSGGNEHQSVDDFRHERYDIYRSARGTHISRVYGGAMTQWATRLSCGSRGGCWSYGELTALQVEAVVDSGFDVLDIDDIEWGAA